MGAVRTLTLNLPEELAARVQSLVESGRYDSPEAVFAAGLDALPEGDEAFDRWLLEEVGPAYDRMMAGEEETFSSEQVFAELRRHHERRVKEAGGS